MSAGDSDRELIGVSPWLIADIMGIITLIVPFAVITSSAPLIYGLAYSQPVIYGLLWVYAPISTIMHSVYDFSLSWMTIPLSVFNLLYFWQVVRYYQDKSSRSVAIWIGTFSIIFPTILFLLATTVFNAFGVFGFILPVPIQFIAGLLIMYRVPGPVEYSESATEMQVLDTRVPERIQVLSQLFSDAEDAGSNDV